MCHVSLSSAFFFSFFFLQLTSQHPYAEVFIGEPHVVTVDIGNLSLVEDTVKRILNLEVSILFVKPCKYHPLLFPLNESLVCVLLFLGGLISPFHLVLVLERMIEARPCEKCLCSICAVRNMW